MAYRCLYKYDRIFDYSRCHLAPNYKALQNIKKLRYLL